jgi:predicted PolB exonuclease-like 3'-5' exonuclease
MITFIDIETLPDLRDGAKAAILAGIKPPAQYKKPESIAEWMRENAEPEAERLWRRTALDGTSGELCAIGYAIEDEPAEVLVRGETGEADLVARFFARMLKALEDRNSHPAAVRWCGHNVAGFDLRFLFQRAAILGVRPTVDLRHTERPGRSIEDTMHLWAGYNGTISLHNLCLALGVPSPKAEGVDGGQVFDLWRAGRVEDIAAYCRGDLEATRECWKRLTFRDRIGWERPGWEDAA